MFLQKEGQVHGDFRQAVIIGTEWNGAGGTAFGIGDPKAGLPRIAMDAAAAPL
jgi:hypothetical protein